MTLWLDLESRSRCDLPSRGVYNYAMDPSTEVLCMSYAFDDEDVQTWRPSEPFPTRVALHNGQIRAHNAAFDRLIIWYVICPDFGIPEPKLEQFYCTATQARANCAPGSLEDVGRFAGAGMRKDHRGAQLIRALSIPQGDGQFREDAGLMAEMIDYCEQDVRAMRAFSKDMRGLTDEELHDYHVNERINDRGVRLDVALAQAAISYATAEQDDIQAVFHEITGLNSVRSPRMREWVYDRAGPQARKLMTGVEGKVSIDKTVRANLLAMEDHDEIPPEVREVVQCADDIWASSVAKFARAAALSDDEDGRVRGAFVFCGGSATGRACVAASTLVQSEYGQRPISALAVGEKVLTHTGQFCRVSRVIYKGRQTMYRIKTAAGGWVDCTADHAILTNKGWTRVEELIRNKEQGSPQSGDSVVYIAAVAYDGRSGAADRSDTCNCLGNRARNGRPEIVAYSESGELLEIEDGREEPYVWSAPSSGSDPEGWLSVSLGWRQHIRAGTSLGADESVGLADVAGRVGNPSHRQQQNEQLAGQLGGCDPAWASTVALTEDTEIVCVGEKGVWDVSVEGDASYVAQGLIHHNSSYGLQVHNFPRKCAKEPELVREAMVRRHAIVPQYGKRVTDVLKSMLRPALLPAAGKSFIVYDWASIEARVTPWLSLRGEDTLQVFREGRDIYVAVAAKMFNIAEGDVSDEQRQLGKVAVLACGFAGGIGAFAAMGRVYGVHMPEHEAKRTVDLWRKANSWAVPFWSELEHAYISAIRRPGEVFTAGRVQYRMQGAHLYYALPSGRVLCYPYARIEDDGVSYAKASWKPAADAKAWPRARLWKGLACENIVQATANDLLRYALRRMDEENIPVVLHVHDETVAEVDTDTAEELARRIKEIMVDPPAWAIGLPLAASGKIMPRYGK